MWHLRVLRNREGGREEREEYQTTGGRKKERKRKPTNNAANTNTHIHTHTKNTKAPEQATYSLLFANATTAGKTRSGSQREKINQPTSKQASTPNPPTSRPKDCSVGR